MGMTETWPVDDVPTDIENFILELLHRLVPESDKKLQDKRVFRNILPIEPSTPQYNREVQRRVLTPEAQAAATSRPKPLHRVTDIVAPPLLWYRTANRPPHVTRRNYPTGQLMTNTSYTVMVVCLFQSKCMP